MKKTVAVQGSSFLDLYERFIKDSKRGKRLQPNGKRFSKETIANYEYTRQLVERFCLEKSVDLRVCSGRLLNQRQQVVELHYWKRFYRNFTEYLYKDCGFYDNYAGQAVKNLKVFFNFLKKDLALQVGDFHRSFYVHKEEIQIHPLLPEELHFLIYDKAFETGLKPRMKEVKDFFVFGCTVALRVSDLFSLQKANIRETQGAKYLVVRSKKTATDTLVKLPEYASVILNKYAKKKGKKLLPAFNKTNLNHYIKLLLEQAGFTAPVYKTRTRRGMPVAITSEMKEPQRFCDLATTHTMRRTAITTMLSLGVSEQIVRQISGHAPGSKEFYRYVQWSQVYQDRETEKMFGRLEQLGNKNNSALVNIGDG